MSFTENKCRVLQHPRFQVREYRDLNDNPVSIDLTVYDDSAFRGGPGRGTATLNEQYARDLYLALKTVFGDAEAEATTHPDIYSRENR